MKKLIAYLTAALAMLALGGAALAGDTIEIFTLPADNLTTNSGVVYTNTMGTARSGEVLGVYLDIGSVAGATVTVVVATHATSGAIDVAQTLLDVTNVVADTVYPVRDMAVYAGGAGNFASNPVPFYLYKDFVYATFTNGCTNATIDIKAHVLIKPQ